MKLQYIINILTNITVSIKKSRFIIGLFMGAIFSMLFPIMDYFFREDRPFADKVFPRMLKRANQSYVYPGIRYPEILDLQS
jgi:hypothetical protein